MRQPVSQECLDCLMEDVWEARRSHESVSLAPTVLESIIQELVWHRAGRLTSEHSSVKPHREAFS